MSGAYSAFQRIGRDGSVDSPGVGTRTPIRKAGGSDARLSNIVLGSGGGGGGSVSGFAGGSTGGASNLGDSGVFGGSGGGGGSNFGTSPTKRHSRLRQRPNYRHPTTTIDVAAAAFHANAKESVRSPAGNSNIAYPAGSNTQGGARSPRKRASAIGLNTAVSANQNNSHIGIGVGGSAGASGVQSNHPHASIPSIPPGLVEMLDGLHSEDELCVTFSISWPELERILIQIGLPHVPPETDTDDDDLASTQRSEWRNRAAAASAAAGASSGWSSNKPRMSVSVEAGG